MPAKVQIHRTSTSFLAVGLGFLMALPGELSAFAGSADPGQVESSSQADSKPPGPLAVRPGSKLAAVLQTTLDVLATRVGDEVVARVTGNLKQGGRTVVHQGDRIVGRVTGVRPQSVGKGQKGSEIAIVFDRLQSGANLYRLNATVRSVVSTPGQRRHASPQHAAVARQDFKSSRPVSSFGQWDVLCD